MAQIEAGMPARSLAGHDQGKNYIIIRCEEEYVWLVDGIRHKLENPKKKNKKHIQAVFRVPGMIRRLQENGQIIKNEHIIQAIQAEGHELAGG